MKKNHGIFPSESDLFRIACVEWGKGVGEGNPSQGETEWREVLAVSSGLACISSLSQRYCNHLPRTWGSDLISNILFIYARINLILPNHISVTSPLKNMQSLYPYAQIFANSRSTKMQSKTMMYIMFLFILDIARTSCILRFCVFSGHSEDIFDCQLSLSPTEPLQETCTVILQSLIQRQQPLRAGLFHQNTILFITLYH